MTKTLLLPFYCDGYDEDVFRAQILSFTESLTGLGLEVTAATPMKSYREAEKASHTYHPFDFDMVVCLAATWSEPRLASVAARAFFGMPTVVFGINEFTLNGARTEFSSAPASAALYGCFTEMGVKAEFMTGDPEEEDNAKRLLALAKAAEAIRKLRNTKIGFFGHNFNGITEAGLDLSLLRRKFGTEVYSFDGSQLIRELENLPEDSTWYRKAEKQVDEKVENLPSEYREKVIRMTGALYKYAEEYDLDALALRCHTEFSCEYGLSLCLPLSLVGNERIVACEADMPVLFTETLFSYLSGGKTPTYADLRTFTKEGLDVGACGMCPGDLTGGKISTDGANGYLTNKSNMNDGRLTLGRLTKRPGGQLFIHASEGTATAIENRLTEYGCAGYPMTHIKPDMDMSRFMALTGANHYAIVYDEIVDALKYFCKYMGVGTITL